MNKPAAALIACVKSKHPKPMAAKDLYASALFTKSRSFAEQRGLPVYILSAKYGLISGDRIITPYEQTLNTMGRDEISIWAANVAKDIQSTFGDQALLVMAGEKYLSFCDLVSNPIINPMKGLSIGKRLQWLNHHTN
jgi:hypothetical protein